MKSVSGKIFKDFIIVFALENEIRVLCAIFLISSKSFVLNIELLPNVDDFFNLNNLLFIINL